MGTSQSKGIYPDTRVVEISDGKIIGRRLVDDGERPADAFQGIPFAKPPVGELRFRKPEPPEPWEGIKECKQFGKRGMQKDVIPVMEEGKPSEDCLYLNVFAPAWNAPLSGFPVMVWIHGGGFSIGGAITYGDMGICKHLVSRGVVVVTVQYRLGYLGFWNTGDSACPANLGLWDQTLALEWVQKNIGAFGGDNKNVTLFGQSAGGVSTDMLHLSPHSQNLFHKFIPMAGSALCYWAFGKNTKAKCDRKAKKMGLTWNTSEELMEKLRAVDARKFTFPFIKIGQEMQPDLEITPVFDGDFFPESIEELRRKAPPKPLMTGVTKMEALIFSVLAKPNEHSMWVALDHCIPEKTEERFEHQEKLVSSYYDYKRKHQQKIVTRARLELFSDGYMNAPALHLAQETMKHNDGTAPVFLYVFEHYNPKSWGVFNRFLRVRDCSHCSELAYVFGKSTLFDFKYDEDDMKMLDLFSTSLTNFAKYGDPNGSGGAVESDLPFSWPALNWKRPENHAVFATDKCRVRDSFFHGRPSTILRYQGKAMTNESRHMKIHRF